MKIEADHSCRWCVSINVMELPDSLESFKKREPSTAIIEQQARQLVAKQFQSRELREFIRAVCKWGGYEGVAGRVLKNNSKQQLRESFRSAHSHAASNNDREAINSLLNLNGLAVSFASKHLKFLAPEKAVVLDSIISERLGYPRTLDGYLAFLGDCRSILEHAVACNVHYTGWGKQWRVSDIEMAIFETLRATTRDEGLATRV